MDLERLYVDIDGVQLDDSSFLDGHTLHLSRDELEKTVSDIAFKSVSVELAAPGSQCRILNMGDVVQPVFKPDQHGSEFPGIIGRMTACGTGKTVMLRNIAVSESPEVPIQIPCILQLDSDFEKDTPFAGMWHLVIVAQPGEGISRADYLTALHKASKKLAVFLASLAKDAEPDETEVIALGQDGLEGLPRIAYLCNIFCHAPFTEATVYGESMSASLPTIITPAEILDGAVTNMDYDNSVNASPTYVWQNHPVILDLCRRHGKDLNFVGVVLSNVHHTVESKQRNATIAASLVNNQLHAAGCIISKEGGGHPQIDVGLDIEILEGSYGIKTAAMLCEFMSSANDSYGQVLFRSDYADAIVSTGCFAPVTLPKTDRVLGSVLSMATADGTLGGELTLAARSMIGCQNQMGLTKHGSTKF